VSLIRFPPADTDCARLRCQSATPTPFMLHIYAALAEKERAMVADRTRKALRELKAKGAKLGNRTNLADASRAGAAVNRGEANAFAANVLPIIRELRRRGIAAALNARSVRTARGGRWSAVQVGRVLERAG
jgi:DNA invertase Pin-like site-specific DNA recombinase